MLLQTARPRFAAANDVIQEVNRQGIKSAQEYEQAVSKIGDKDGVLLLVFREGGSMYHNDQTLKARIRACNTPRGKAAKL